MTKENKEQYFKTGEKCIKCGGTQYFIIPFENKELYKCCGCYRKMKKENPELHKKMMKRPDENNSKPWNEYPIEMLKKTILRDEMMKIVGKEKGKIMKKEIKKEAEEKNEDWCPNCKIHVLGKDIGFGGHHKKCDHPVIQTCDIEEYLKINFFDKLPALPYKRPKKDNPVKKVNHEKYPEFKCIASYYYREEKDLFDKNVNIALSEGWKILDIKIIQESDRDGSYPIFCAIMGLWDCQQRRRNNMKYVDRFLKLNSAPDILEKCNRTLNCKEISENYAAISVIFKKYIKERGNADVLFLDVGCGYVPRLAIMMAHLTNWTCLAIDPVLRLKDYKTDRLWKIKSKLEDQIDFLTPQLKAHQIVIAAYVHSHAKENLLVPYCDLMVSIPCCFSSDFENIDRVDSFIDESILSPKNKVFVYNKSKEK